MSDEKTPEYRGFEYKLRLAVSIPLAWAEFLRTVALQHYDLWCRESAKAGVVNGLRNTACDSEYPSSFPVEWRDLDLLAKIMEQSHYHAVSEPLKALAVEINAWIRQVKDWLVEREAALVKWDSEQISPVPIRSLASEE
jgi:hypothetical protein